MVEQLNPVATHHLPVFITPPGQTDVLMIVLAVFLAVCVFAFGIFYWRLHSLPERVAHKSHKIQFEIVAILGLIALFTHEHIFWIAGLLLAFIDLPDIGGFLGRIAGSVERMAGLKPAAEVVDTPQAITVEPSRAAEVLPDWNDRKEPSATNKPLRALAGGKEVDHA